MTNKKTINIFPEGVNMGIGVGVNVDPDGNEVCSSNEYPWLDGVEVIEKGRKIVQYYLDTILEKSCLEGFEFESLTFDILFCDSEKTHEINKEYREKDYAADIITFAIFADDDAKFILDDDINLGEIIIAVDKVIEEAKKAEVSEKYELYYLIAHGILHLLGFDHQTEEEYNFITETQKAVLEEIL